MKKHKIVLALMMMLIGLGFSSFVFAPDFVSAATYSASISTSGNINLDVSSAGNGANITTDNVSIVSTCPYGYNVSIAAKSATNTTFSDTTLYKDGDKTNTADTKKINTSTGTIASPVSILGNNNKTWGYTTSDIMGGIDSVSINSNFVGLTNTQAIISTSSTNTPAEGTTLPVYYGVSVDNTIEPGLYKMSDDAVITYYLTTSLDCTSYQVAFNPTSTAGGQTLSGTGTMDNQRIEEGVATNLAANTFTAPTGYEFKEWNTAQDGTGTSYTNNQSVTDLTSIGNTITLYAQWQRGCADNRICYFENGSNVEGTMGNQTANANASVTLLASNFSRTGYGFAGWSPDENVTASSKIYGPQETITTPASMTGGMKLYAVWVQSQGSLQDSSKVASVCSSLVKAPTDGTANLSSVSALTDSRDNNTYAIAKLADGNCWMIENLRLENTADHNTDGTLAQGYNASFAGLADPEAASLFTSTATANSLYSTDGSTDKTISGSNQGYRFPRYNNVNTPTATADRPQNPTSNSAANSTSGASMYSYGNYYTWSAAIADTTAYTSGNTSVTNTSICPAGWHLPKGGSSANAANSDFWQLGLGIMGATPSNNSYYQNSETNSAGKTARAAFRSYPNNFVYSGNVNGGSVSGRDSSGYFWSSTAYSSNYAYYLDLNSSNVYPGTSISLKYGGRAVRCVASDPTTPANKIGYFPNAPGVTDNMGNQSITSTDTEAVLWASNFQRPGYGFAGWNTRSNGSGTKYGPNETITFTAGQYSGENQGLSLFAMWVKSEGDLQDWTGCSTMTANQVTALTDTRDNQTYAVAKLADGNCWMIENLRLDNQYTTSAADIAKAQGYNSSFIGLANSENTYFTDSSAANSLYSTDGSTSAPAITGSNTSYRFPRYNNRNTSFPAINMAAWNNSTNVYSVGNLYTWSAAIADTSNYATNNQSISTTSICPKGWKLPSAGNNANSTNSDFRKLSVAIIGAEPNYVLDTYTKQYDDSDGSTKGTEASKAIRSYPNNFIYSGVYSGTSSRYKGSFGAYWSSTTSSSNNSYGLGFRSTYVGPGTDSFIKYVGSSIRCLIP